MKNPTAELLAEATQLKHIDRAGWLRLGITHPESVAAHSFGVAFSAMLLCPPGLDRERVLMMALLHDLAEARVGDITPHDGVPREEKKRQERAAISVMLATRPDLLALWEEMEANDSPEAHFVHEMDKLDLGLTARQYDHLGHLVAELLAVGEPSVRRWLEAPRRDEPAAGPPAG